MLDYLAFLIYFLMSIAHVHDVLHVCGDSAGRLECIVLFQAYSTSLQSRKQILL